MLVLLHQLRLALCQSTSTLHSSPCKKTHSNSLTVPNRNKYKTLLISLQYQSLLHAISQKATLQTHRIPLHLSKHFKYSFIVIILFTSLHSVSIAAVLLIGPTVFHGKFCQIPRASSQNSAAHHL